MNRTAIDYVDYTWNPYTGCLHGCSYCYARRITRRFGGPEPEDKVPREGRGAFPYGFAPTFYPSRLGEPKRVKVPSRIFVADMGDLFGDWVPREWIERILDVVHECPWHTFLFLTKNPWRYQEFEFPENAWIGTTAEEWALADERIPVLLRVPAALRWVSIEPMLGPIRLTAIKFQPGWEGWMDALHPRPAWDLPGLDWVVVGKETGPGACPIQAEWVERLIAECHEERVPIWVKKPLYNEFPIQELPAKGEEK